MMCRVIVCVDKDFAGTHWRLVDDLLQKVARIQRTSPSCDLVEEPELLLVVVLNEIGPDGAVDRPVRAALRLQRDCH